MAAGRIANLGNTSYVSAGIQMLCCMKPLVAWAEEHRTKMPKGGVGRMVCRVLHMVNKQQPIPSHIVLQLMQGIQKRARALNLTILEGVHNTMDPGEWINTVVAVLQSECSQNAPFPTDKLTLFTTEYSADNNEAVDVQKPYFTLLLCTGARSLFPFSLIEQLKLGIHESQNVVDGSEMIQEDVISGRMNGTYSRLNELPDLLLIHVKDRYIDSAFRLRCPYHITFLDGTSVKKSYTLQCSIVRSEMQYEVQDTQSDSKSSSYDDEAVFHNPCVLYFIESSLDKARTTKVNRQPRVKRGALAKKDNVVENSTRKRCCWIPMFI